MRQVDISLTAYHEFWTQTRQSLQNPKTKLMAVVKANAYGLGAIPLATYLQTHHLVDYLGVATVPEAAQLRKANITLPILVLSHPDPEDIDQLEPLNLEQVVYTAEMIAQLQKFKLKVHLKIDTGMGRIGCAPTEAATLLTQIQTQPNLTLTGVCTHFASADDPQSTFTQTQLTTFLDTLAPRQLPPTILRHAANSAATHNFPHTQLDMVRIGIHSYTPIATLKTRVQAIQHVPANTPISYNSTYHTPTATQIAVIDIGYADGVPRNYQGQVLIQGHTYPIVGRVCMDMLMVNVGQAPIQVNDEVVLFGQQGDASIPLETFSQNAGRITYESLCALSTRVGRKYIEETPRP